MYLQMYFNVCVAGYVIAYLCHLCIVMHSKMTRMLLELTEKSTSEALCYSLSTSTMYLDVLGTNL